VIVVAGEALIDLMPRAGESRESPEFREFREFRGGEAGAGEARDGEFEAGEVRAVAQQFDARPGGAPCNVAVGLARLGRRACFLGRVGDDPFGRLLRQHLREAGVDTSMVVAASEKTTLAIAALDGQGKAEYIFYANGTADWQWTDAEVPQSLPAVTRALYVGGLAFRFAPGATVLEGLMRRTREQGRVLVFFDPNVRTGFGFSAEAERARVERQLTFAHVIKASEDDIALLYPGRDYREIAAAWHESMSGLVAVTLGAGGVYALAPDGSEMHVPAAPARVVDTVGAGDAFAAAMLDRLAGEMPGAAGAGAGPGSASGPGDTTGPASAGAGLGDAAGAGAARAGAAGAGAAGGLDGPEGAAAVPNAAAALRAITTEVLRGLFERASVSAALTCERAGAQSPDACTLDAAMEDEARRPAEDLAADPAAGTGLSSALEPGSSDGLDPGSSSELDPGSSSELDPGSSSRLDPGLSSGLESASNG